METEKLAHLIEPAALSAYTRAFKALGHPARLHIFFYLVTQGEQGAPVGDIKAYVRIPDSTLSHHLDTLRQANLLHSTRQQQWIYYHVNPAMTRQLVRLLTACC